MDVIELAIELGFTPVVTEDSYGKQVHVHAERGADLEALRQLSRQMCPYAKHNLMYIGYNFDMHTMGMRIA